MLSNVTVHDMSTVAPIQVFVLQEFRLLAADTDGAVARIVAASPGGIEPAIPLLTSIDDGRDVATLRALHEGEATETDAVQHAALDPLVASWAAPKQYRPRVAERSPSPPSHFRLAVTESGINNGEVQALTTPPGSEDRSTRVPIGLVWIGAPTGTYAGLLVLLGSYGESESKREPSGWPLPLSRELGVRIYDNSRV
jgi:hypothetical protein